MSKPKKEKTVRLIPKPDVLRELYLKSGNICAFPNCNHPIINSDGTYIAQLCHIEAANEGGQRFNPKQTNEDRRQFSNLILMCHRHHKETDDVSKFSVQKLKEIKQIHEAKFENVLNTLANEVYDIAYASQPKKFSNINKLVELKLFNKNLTLDIEEEINDLINILQEISPKTRKIFLLIINRIDPKNYHFSLNEFQYIISIDRNEAKNHLSILSVYGFLYDDECTDFNERKIVLQDISKIAILLKEFCEISSNDLSSMLVDLDFSQLEV